eukprot:1709282-Lingulodinium_polyedra.AAC.1
MSRTDGRRIKTKTCELVVCGKSTTTLWHPRTLLHASILGASMMPKCGSANECQMAAATKAR